MKTVANFDKIQNNRQSRKRFIRYNPVVEDEIKNNDLYDVLYRDDNSMNKWKTNM